MEGPGHFTFKNDRTGLFQFGLVQGEMDCQGGNQEPRKQRIEFSWAPDSTPAIHFPLDQAKFEKVPCGHS